MGKSQTTSKTRPKKPSPVSHRFTRLRVACFEADWSTDMRDTRSVLPVLELLERCGWIRFFHRRVSSRDELVSELKLWAEQARYGDYEVAFAATHGNPGVLAVGDGDLNLVGSAKDGRASLAEELAGRLRGRIVYFGSCASAQDAQSPSHRARKLSRTLERFRKETGAKIACGYVENVEFEDAAAFEVILFSWLAAKKDRRVGLLRVLDDYPDLVNLLGFRSARATRSTRRAIQRSPNPVARERRLGTERST